MRLDPAGPAPGFPELDERLLPRAGWPVAVAYSGGGDSHALLLGACDWARRRGRRLIVLHVDHRLQAASGDWAQACAETARRLHLDFLALEWTGPKPTTGLAAAARLARHRLLAVAARAAGARVLLLGHTADDVAEAQLMRARGGSVPDPRPWAPSPVWPEGCGLHLLRPLLGWGRRDLRTWLAGRGESWIDDPANEDLARPRSRARAALAMGATAPGSEPSSALRAGELADLARAARHGLGQIVWDRTMFEAASPAARAAALAAACLCAAGTSRPPRGEALAGLCDQIMSGKVFTATLAGARLEASRADLRLCREPGEARRGGMARLRLEAGESGVWDGRWRLKAPEDRVLEITALFGQAGRLDPGARRALGEWPPAVRWGLPVVRHGESLICPPLEPAAGVTAEALAEVRFAAACGLLTHEADLAGWEAQGPVTKLEETGCCA